ncbi:serine hydrolase [Verrucomicrobiaceae bacterium N1E253]|uniref:beta-lactamase n=1 Tax=Oceaniferula marina TaxID=2748318 RepID=A0A851GCY8_9BACT|nr:serine hydrolase [Oceaniferula marina]NWK55413.1 serine hydrolase [Oceaniferula marina]
MSHLHPYLVHLLLVLTLGALSVHSTSAATGSSLEGEIESYIKSLRGKGQILGQERTAWLAYDLTSEKKLAGINVNESLQAASMVKVYLALAFFHQVKAGKLHYGPASRRHMELMIQKSNNTSTNWVMRQTGGPSATQSLLKRHYPSLCHQLYLVEYIPAGGRTYRNRGSAGDYARFLHALWNDKLPHSKEILRLMGLPGRDRLYSSAKRVPTGTKVYNKTGSTAMCCGDMGILVARGSNGQSYPYILIGIIENGNRNLSYGPWIRSRGNVIREVSNMVYLSMKKRYSL